MVRAKSHPLSPAGPRARCGADWGERRRRRGGGGGGVSPPVQSGPIQLSTALFCNKQHSLSGIQVVHVIRFQRRFQDSRIRRPAATAAHARKELRFRISKPQLSSQELRRQNAMWLACLRACGRGLKWHPYPIVNEHASGAGVGQGKRFGFVP